MIASCVLVNYLDSLLRIDEINDESRNGLQVEGADELDKVCFAVDACLATFKEASDRDAQMLIVHHGLFWKEAPLVVDNHYMRIKTLIEGGVGLYAAHLPLDMHEELGNNVQLIELLGLEDSGPFGDYHGELIGRIGESERSMTREEIKRKLDSELDTDCRILPFGPEEINRIGIISGGGARMLADAVEADCDAFITGELEHQVYHTALESGINVITGGHYATETVGLRALRRRIEEEFGIETEFIEMPTGL